MKKNLLKWLLPMIVILNACSKDDAPVAPQLNPTSGVYVLSEGGVSNNNTKLGFYTIGTSLFSGNYFVQQNPTETGLGDTGNDAIIYGGKLYIVMNYSSQLVVLNAATGTLIKRINFGTSPNFTYPRYAVGAKGKVYVTTNADNKVSIIDTTSLSITGSIAVGTSPEGLAVSGNYLYVANSGAANYPDFDSTISVIDLTSSLEIKKIDLGLLNPNKVEVSSNGDVYVSSYGNYSSVSAGVAVINASNNTLKSNLGAGFEYSHLRIFNDLAYFYNNYGGVAVSKVYNTITNTVVRNEFITDGTLITTPYGINIDEQNGDVYICDAKDYVTAGAVTCFNKDGVKKFSFSVTPGISPNKVIFKR